MSQEMPTLEPRPAEAILLRARPLVSPSRVWCTTAGRGQWGAALAREVPAAHVACQFLDLHQSEQAQAVTADVANFEVLCESDPPRHACQLVGLPLPAQGDGELARDWLQWGHRLLEPGGELWAATDNSHDRWLRGEIDRLFEHISVESFPDGRLYRARRTEVVTKYKNFRAEFAFRDGDRLIQLVSRPGVFSHRRIDTGARALIEAMRIEPGNRVLDLGCGSGAVSLAAALRAPDVAVEAVDSNPRAVECVRLGAERNRLTNVTVRLDALAHCTRPGEFDVVVANPPYFSRGRISEIFLAGAAIALRPGGSIWIVTKDPEPLGAAMLDRFDDVTVERQRAYWIVAGRQP